MLKRREVPTLAELARQDAGDDSKPRHKPFKDYEPGFVHIDIKHLPQMPDEEQKRYLYVAIDRATRWVYLEIRRSQSAKDARAFMKRVEEKAPFKIQTVLTDNDIDDAVATMNVVTSATIDGVQDPIAFVAEDIDVGDTNAFYVRPMVGDMPVCQAEVDNTVVSDTPDTCTVTDTEPVETGDHEYGWFSVTGVTEGECIYTVTYPDGNGGEGAEAQFSYTIEP